MFLHRSRVTLQPLFRISSRSARSVRLSSSHTAGSTVASAKNPDDFKGILTKYGWVLVKNSHVARSWTQTNLNNFLDERLPSQAHTDYSKLQKVVDEWMESADLDSKPKIRKKTAEDLRKHEELKLFLKQSKEEGQFRGVRASKASSRAKREVSSTEVTFTYAWNYFMAMTYPKYKEFSPKEARQRVAAEWRSMSMDAKDVYREEYSKLLSQGKDILHGKIVDREVKLKSTERLQSSKERSLRRKAETLKALESSVTEKLDSDKPNEE